jgi:hypothetical protein
MSDDRAQIENLMARYCRVFDSGDFDSYADLFRHGEIVSPAVKLTAAEIPEHYRHNCLLYDGQPNTRHVTTNIAIRVAAGGTTAAAESYVTVYQGAPNFPLQVIFIGSYIDEFHKIAGLWWFKSRRVEAHLVGDLSRHSATGNLPPTHTVP